jgi:cytochrome d ubiquinol oxidase subunit II
MSALQVTWFLLVGILLTVYALLDGFDLGVGFWSIFTRKDEERRVLLGAIGPFWDGNEVWLVTGGGALFAAFPPVYATVFSGFYLAVMLVVFALIFRAVSVEFRSKLESPGWRKAWDACFFAGSVTAALIFGVAVGNLLRGLPLDGQGGFAGGFLDLLSPYAFLVGLTGLAMIAVHGAIYIALKAEGDLGGRGLQWARAGWYAFVVLFIASSLATVLSLPQRLENFRAHPALWAVPGLAAASLGLTGFFLRKGDALRSFIFSSGTVIGLMGLLGASIFPALVPAAGDKGAGLTLSNASSSPLTLRTMLIIAAAGLPFVIGYTIWIYRTFKGKVKAQHLEY